MPNFILFKQEIQRQFSKMQQQDVFRTTADPDEMWRIYLASFPAGTDPIYKTETQHTCSCCRQFIKNAGGMVTVDNNGTLNSLWDVAVPEPYQTVALALQEYVESCTIEEPFLHFERAVGVNKNFQETESGTKTWEHFFINLPNKLVSTNIGAVNGEAKTTQAMMLRALTEITIESAETVLELIDQGSLYRGDEHKHAVQTFLRLKKEFDLAADKEIFCWLRYKQPAARVRNTVIGTLLTDLSEGKDLEFAVKAFETKVAPTNYKRPTALVTQAMIDMAKAKIQELGVTSALDRRYAVMEDVSINDVLFADRSAKKLMQDVFDELTPSKPFAKKNLDKVEEVNIEDFIANILPRAESLSILFDNSHTGNLVSLIAPCDLTAPQLFKWPNPYSWSYAGGLADSIKERVKAAGGKVDGDLRCSLSWSNYDDLDLHMLEPGGRHIYFGSRHSVTTQGELDVDMNAGGRSSRTPVENITYPARKYMTPGTYKLYVNQFSKRETNDVGFEVEIEFDGKIHTLSYPKAVKQNENVPVAEITYSHTAGFILNPLLPSTQAVKQVWGIPTQTYHKVELVCLSPNYWGDKPVGNKHYFFMLEGCRNEDKARGFLNEYLSQDLDQHRKVMEMVGSKMKTEESDRQLSGLGFSSTLRNSILCQVRGSFNRTIKINF